MDCFIPDREIPDIDNESAYYIDATVEDATTEMQPLHKADRKQPTAPFAEENYNVSEPPKSAQSLPDELGTKLGKFNSSIIANKIPPPLIHLLF